MSENRVVIADGNVEVKIVSAYDETKVRHYFKAKNACGPAFPALMCVRTGVNPQDYDSPRYIGLSSQSTALPTTVALGSFWSGAVASVFANRYTPVNDTNGTMIYSYSYTDVPAWIQFVAKFAPPYGNGTTCKTLIWYNSYSGFTNETYKYMAVYVLNVGQWFIKTSSDIVYVTWRLNINASGRTNNAF